MLFKQMKTYKKKQIKKYLFVLEKRKHNVD